MFATKKDIINWCDDFLIKEQGKYFCPSTQEELKIQRVNSYWKIQGKNEEWLWEIEDIKLRGDK